MMKTIRGESGVPCANGCATGCNGLERLGMCNPTKTRATKEVDVRSKAKHGVSKKGDASTRRFSMQKDQEISNLTSSSKEFGIPDPQMRSEVWNKTQIWKVWSRTSTTTKRTPSEKMRSWAYLFRDIFVAYYQTPNTSGATQSGHLELLETMMPESASWRMGSCGLPWWATHSYPHGPENPQFPLARHHNQSFSQALGIGKAP